MANYYTDKTDTLSPPSMSGVVGFATTNGSWGAGIMQNYNFGQDRWRMQARLFYLSINQILDLGEIGDADATRLMFVASLNVRRQIFQVFFLELGYNFKSVEYEGRDGESQDRLDRLFWYHRSILRSLDLYC